MTTIFIYFFFGGRITVYRYMCVLFCDRVILSQERKIKYSNTTIHFVRVPDRPCSSKPMMWITLHCWPPNDQWSHIKYIPIRLQKIQEIMVLYARCASAMLYAAPNTFINIMYTYIYPEQRNTRWKFHKDNRFSYVSSFTFHFVRCYRKYQKREGRQRQRETTYREKKMMQAGRELEALFFFCTHHKIKKP